MTLLSTKRLESNLILFLDEFRIETVQFVPDSKRKTMLKLLKPKMNI